MERKVWLPTAGEKVSFDGLLSSADADARKALELAAAFNAHRAEAISLSLQQIDDAAFPEQAKVGLRRPSGLSGIDVLVGLALFDSRFVASFLPNGLAESTRNQIERQRTSLRAYRPEQRTRTSEPLARMYAWNRKLAAWPPIDASVLTGSLTDDVLWMLAAWDAEYAAGGCTLSESFGSVWRHVSASAFEEPPLPYVERGDELHELDRLMLQHQSVFVLGAEGSGRSALASAWLARVRCREAAAGLSPYFGVGGIRGRSDARAPRWRQCPIDRKPIEAIDVDALGHSNVDELRHSNPRRLVLVTPESFPAARQALDPLGEFGIYELAPLSLRERILIWLCATLDVPDALARVLSVFANAKLETPEEPWFPWSRDGRRLEGWFEYAALRPDEFRILPWVERSVRSGHLVPPPLPDTGRWRSLESLLGAGGLSELSELEKILATPASA